MVDDLFANRLHPTGIEFERHEGYPRGDGGCLIVPGRYWHGHEAEISMALSRYGWVLLMVTSDEESLFDVRRVVHPNMRVWQQTPRPGRDYGGARVFGLGYTPHVRMLPTEEKTLNVFLAAQDTHERRHDCFLHLEGLRGSRVERTAGFTQGMDPAEYMRCMAKAKVAPAPAGAVSVDSFRFWEALEAGAIPVADSVSPVDGETHYWEQIFGTYHLPFPVITDWSQVSWTDLLTDWNPEPVTEWYHGYKQRLARWLRADLEALGAC